MDEWKRTDNWTNQEAEYHTTIGGCSVEVRAMTSASRADHWAYTITHPGGFHMSGHSFPWSCERAMNYTVVVLALRAFSRVLIGKNMEEGWYDEDTIDRV